MRTVATILAVLISGLVLAIPLMASAQTAREHYRRGQSAYQQGDYETAIEQWQRAYQLEAKPRLQYNLAQAYERLGRLNEAVKAMEVYLKTTPPDDPKTADARARLALLRERLRKTGIQLRGGVDGATILIDGEDWGRTPRRDPISLKPGMHDIQVTKEGYKPFAAKMVVSEGQTIDVDVEMEELEPEEREDAVAGMASEAEAQEAALDEEQEAEGTTDILPYVLMGGGGALAVGGIVLGALALSKAGDAPSDDSDEADSARGLALGCDILIAAGVVTAGVGVVLLVLEPQEKAPETSAQARLRVAPVAGPGHAGAHAVLRF